MAKKDIAKDIDEISKATLAQLNTDIRGIVSEASVREFDSSGQMLQQLYNRFESELFSRLERHLKQYTTEIKVGSHVSEIIRLVKGA